MSTNTDLKKITASFTGDEAIEIELLEKALRLDKLTKTKSQRDHLFFGLALGALRNAIESYSNAHQVKYPSYEQIKAYLHMKIV